jgi:hypothetical protein
VRASGAAEGTSDGQVSAGSEPASSWNEGGPVACARAAIAELSVSGVPSARPSPKIQRDAKSDMPSGAAKTGADSTGARESRRAMRATWGLRRSATRVASCARGA